MEKQLFRICKVIQNKEAKTGKKKDTENFQRVKFTKFQELEVQEELKTYAIEKAIEELYGEMEENFVSFDMQRGIETEPIAFGKFKEIKGLDFFRSRKLQFL